MEGGTDCAGRLESFETNSNKIIIYEVMASLKATYRYAFNCTHEVPMEQDSNHIYWKLKARIRPGHKRQQVQVVDK